MIQKIPLISPITLRLFALLYAPEKTNFKTLLQTLDIIYALISLSITSFALYLSKSNHLQMKIMAYDFLLTVFLFKHYPFIKTFSTPSYLQYLYSSE